MKKETRKYYVGKKIKSKNIFNVTFGNRSENSVNGENQNYNICDKKVNKKIDNKIV